MGKLVITGLSNETLAALGRRADSHGRTLAEEAAEILQSAAEPPAEPPADLAARRRAALHWMRENVKGADGPPYSIDIIREDRER